MIAPPRLNAKSTVIDFGVDVLRLFPLLLCGPESRRLSFVNIIQDKTTPEKLLERLEPGVTKLRVENKSENIPTASQAAIVISELGTLLGKQRYNEGMVSNLMRLFDCPDSFEMSTMARGVQVLNDVYVTIIAGTTPRALVSSVPESATEEGLLSRMIPVYQHRHTRVYPMPKKVEEGPGQGELAKRLAWIAANHQGEYFISPDAYAYYERWYREFKEVYSKTWEDRMAQARMDNYVLKLAFLIRASYYEKSKEVTLDDVKDALKILNATYSRASDALVDVGTTLYQQHLRSAERKIRESKSITRRGILVGVRWSNSEECTQAMNQLFQEGKIGIYVGSVKQKRASSHGEEKYEWLKQKEEQAIL